MTSIEIKPLPSERDMILSEQKIKAIKSVRGRLRLAGFDPTLKESKHIVDEWTEELIPSRIRLLRAFADREEFTVEGVTGIIASLEHESGSGYSFNVRFEGRADSVYLFCKR